MCGTSFTAPHFFISAYFEHFIFIAIWCWQFSPSFSRSFPNNKVTITPIYIFLKDFLNLFLQVLYQISHFDFYLKNNFATCKKTLKNGKLSYRPVNYLIGTATSQLEKINVLFRANQLTPETGSWSCSVRKIFLEILQYSQESTFFTVSFCSPLA